MQSAGIVQAFIRHHVGGLILGLLLGAGAAWADAWSEIQSRGVLRWGNDAEGGAPYLYADPQDPDRVVGFEVDLAEALAQRLGLRGEFIQNNWDLLIPALKDGSKFDVIIAALERTEENLSQLSMSRPYFAYGQQLVVLAGRTNMTRLADLKGKSVGVLSASASHRLAEAEGGLDVRIYADNVNYFRELEVGRLDAVLTDTPIARLYVAENPKLAAAGEPFALGSYAIGVRPEDTELLGRINAALESLLADGTLERIYRKYGQWDADQARLAEWQTEDDTMPRRQQVSTWRDWRIYLPLLLRASVTTVWVTCCGMVLAVAWGLVLALGRIWGPAPVRWLAIAYIEVFRGTPLLLQIYFIYFGLAQQLGLRLSAGVAAVVALGLNYAANEAENYRGGILGVPRGQMDAALALGMGRGLALRLVVLPQALRISLPSITNDFIAMFKDSSIVSVIALVELTKEYQIRAIATGDYIGLGLMTAGIYFTISYAASQGARTLERRLRRDPR